MKKTVVFDCAGIVTAGDMDLVKIYITPEDKKVNILFKSDDMRLEQYFHIKDERISDMTKADGFNLAKKLYVALNEYHGFIDISFLEKKVGKACDELVK